MMFSILYEIGIWLHSTRTSDRYQNFLFGLIVDKCRLLDFHRAFANALCNEL